MFVCFFKLRIGFYSKDSDSLICLGLDFHFSDAMLQGVIRFPGSLIDRRTIVTMEAARVLLLEGTGLVAQQ